MSVMPAKPRSDVDAIWKTVEETGLLPMPGGYGVRPFLKSGSCGNYRAAFPLALRAEATVLMLADMLAWDEHRLGVEEWVDRLSKELGSVAGDGVPGGAQIDRLLHKLPVAGPPDKASRTWSPHEYLDVLFGILEPRLSGEPLQELRAFLEKATKFLWALGHKPPTQRRQAPLDKKSIIRLCLLSKSILPIEGSLAQVPGDLTDAEARTAYGVLLYFNGLFFQRFLAKTWRDATLAWFAQYANDWDDCQPREKCQAMLVAMVDKGRPLEMEAEAAHARLKDLSMNAERLPRVMLPHRHLPAALRQPRGETGPTRELTQQLLGQLADGSLAPRLRARLLIRTLLARLEIPLGRKKRPPEPARKGFFDPALNLLKTCIADRPPQNEVAGLAPARRCPGLREAIAKAEGLIEGLVLVLSEDREWSPDPNTPMRQPLFALYDPAPLPSFETLVQEVDEDLRAGMRAIETAAQLVLDVLLDPMHAGQARFFGQPQYRYLSGVIKGDGSLHNYLNHLAQEPCATRSAVQACVPEPVETPATRCRLCLCR